jgi:tetratricopeptide (TPR) repeat protein
MNEHDLQERKAFLEATEAFLHKSDYMTVLSLAESRLKRAPGDMDARIVICRVWIEQEKFEEAEEMLREMGDILASLSQIYTHMGDIYLKKGMPESAQTFYRMFVDLNPDTPMALEISERLKGVPRQQATDDRAIVDREEAAQVPDGLQTVTLAELYIRQGHLQVAEEILAAILNKGPHHPKAAEMLREVRERIAAPEEPKQEHAPAMPRDVRERFVGPDEPEARPTPEIRREAQEKIVGSEGPGEQHVAEMPREVREGIAAPEEPWGKHAAVIAELSRWLNNIGRLSSHAA